MEEGRSFLAYYILNTAGDTSIKSGYVIDWTYSNGEWYYKDITVTGLTSGSQVRVAFGRSDAWLDWDWSLKAEWAQITVYSDGARAEGVSGQEAFTTSPESNSPFAPQYNLTVTPVTATIKSSANTTATLTATWLNKTSVPLKVIVNVPQGLSASATSVSMSNSTTTYNIVVFTDPKLPAGTYQVNITALPDCNCSNKIEKTVVLSVKVEG